jgi:hypothetical protein
VGGLALRGLLDWLGFQASAIGQWLALAASLDGKQ